MNISDFVIKDNTAYFDSFRNGIFYYNIYKANSDIQYQFQIPIEEIAGATIKAEEKSITMMRWIRKSIGNKTFIKI